MSTPRYVILIDRHAWHVCRVDATTADLTEVATPDGRVPIDGAVAGLRQAGWEGAPVAVGLPASWCLAASIEAKAAGRRVTGDTMAYLLEDKLPVAAEAFVCDFTPGRQTPGSQTPGSGEDRRLGVCVELDRVRPIVEALAAHDVAVDLIAPTTMLAVHGRLHDDDDAAATSRQVCELFDGDHRELVVVDHGVPISWSLHRDEDSVRRARVVDGLVDVPTRSLNGEAYERAARMAAMILDDRAAPWLNLRRGALAPGDRWERLRTPVHAALVAASVLMAVVTGVMLYRAHQFDALARRDRLAQADVYHQVLPDHRVPANPHSRLISEHRRLVGVNAAGGAADSAGSASDVSATIASSALGDLVRLLDTLPDNLRYRILELRLDAGRIYIDGQTRTLSDPEAIAGALTAGGFRVDPPRTQRLKEQGVGFVVTANSTPEPPEAPEPPEPTEGGER